MKKLLKSIVVAILTWEAKRVLSKYKPKVVAVTGSVGKTSTKDAIYTVLSQDQYVRKSEKSFNSEIGVPLTVLGIPNAWNSALGWIENILEGLHVVLFRHEYPKWLILEVGADRPGDIRALAWLKPQIVVFTRFPDVPVHIEYFDSKEAVIAEKLELKKALRDDGTLIINGDDPAMAKEEVKDGQHLLTYGFKEDLTVFMSDHGVSYAEARPVGMNCLAHFQNDEVQLNLSGTLGRHHLYPLVAALTVAVSTGMAFKRATEILKTHVPPPGRMSLLRGIKNSTIIDDTYNSSPVAVEAGLDTLISVQVPGKKIAVLGDMFELGAFSVTEHRNIGVKAAGVANILITVGIRMLTAAEAANSIKGNCERIDALKVTDEVIAVLRDTISDGDIIFVKGSQSMRMERVVEAILQDPSTAVKVLVRQDPHWKIRK